MSRPLALFRAALSAALVASAVLAAPLASAEVQAPAPAATADYEYRLGAGDKLRLIVFGEDQLGGEFLVSNTGTVALPLIGEVRAQGATPTEFQTAVEAKLRDGYLKDPKVSVEVLNFRPYFILGEVNKPGQYTYTNQLTVMNAVATAQGFTYRADTRKVFIRHVNDTSEHGEKLSPNLQVLPGDTIRIPEHIF